MTDLLRRSSDWLQEQRTRHAASTVKYVRGSWSVELSATIGKTTFEVDDGCGVLVRHESRDFLVLAGDLLLTGALITPERGDRIEETQSQRAFVYEVTAPGKEPCWRYSDAFRKTFRIHTKQVQAKQEIMPNTTVQIADALVVALNGHAFSRPFRAVRAYVPVYELKDMETLHVTVVPAELQSEPSDRTRDREDHTLHVCVQQRFRQGAAGVPLEWLDTLVGLCEEIRDLLRTAQLQTGPSLTARWVKSETKPVYDPKHLGEYGQFTCLMAFTYRVVR